MVLTALKFLSSLLAPELLIFFGLNRCFMAENIDAAHGVSQIDLAKLLRVLDRLFGLEILWNTFVYGCKVVRCFCAGIR